MGIEKAPIPCGDDQDLRRIGSVPHPVCLLHGKLAPSKAEVRALLRLLKEYLENEVQEMMDQDIRLVAIATWIPSGNRSR